MGKEGNGGRYSRGGQGGRKVGERGRRKEKERGEGRKEGRKGQRGRTEGTIVTVTNAPVTSLSLPCVVALLIQTWVALPDDYIVRAGDVGREFFMLSSGCCCCSTSKAMRT